MADAGSFPRRHARTRGFTLGRPRGFAVGADGARVAFLRSTAGDDPVNRLWALDLAGGGERLVADPDALVGGSGGSGGLKASPPVDGASGELPDAERARRERARERAGGIVAFGADRDLTVAAFALTGRLFVASLADSAAPARELAGGGVLDPRVDPTGRRVAWVAERALYVADLDGGRPAGALVREDDPEVTWGLAEFVAAEEMGRNRGFWWAPDGERLAVARVDTRAVQRFHLTDPADPAAEPVRLPYPAAGTANADVRLAVVGLDGGRVEVSWDRVAFPYLAAVVWEPGGPLTLLVQARDQTATRVLGADPDSGATTELAAQRDPAWVELVPGVPAWLDGRLVLTADDAGCDTRRLTVDGAPVTPPGLQVQEVVAVTGGAVLLAGSEEPTEVHLWRVVPGDPAERLTSEPGLHGAVAAGEVAVLTSATLDRDGTSTTVHRAGRPPLTIGSLAEAPAVRPRPLLLRAGRRELRTALLLPEGPFQVPLPVLLDPYGGPLHRRVVAARGQFLESQWFADQGFAVLVADGRGTPGRGPAWERAVHRDLAGPALDDQVEALHAVAARHPELDLDRVAIRGWSFGGYLAALAVLRRPDVFHAAVAGAPVTDWRLYDTHYAERYLGHPDGDPDAYRRSSLLADAPRTTERPLLLIHGLADDNVVAAHSLRLSGLLLAAGRPHSVLPLPGVTHMAVQEAVAENLLHLQLRFLRDALGVGR
ncbi:MAG TPA: prolyl oligopeptidase family serine peptidase [Actinomycetota bacterium]|nr:prolyl oligopeptidase family serine peptidase [Actinomycetota bacterium]